MGFWKKLGEQLTETYEMALKRDENGGIQMAIRKQGEEPKRLIKNIDKVELLDKKEELLIEHEGTERN